ncbi:MAG: hypothetical protein M3257_01065 [Actinomycetota bacterium]|nr:hypothetical protein [Actinomycetota bacterium]
MSYWENWPSRTGHAPSLAVLDRLAQLYDCDVADLVPGWGEHGPADVTGLATAEPESRSADRASSTTPPTRSPGAA